MPFLLTFLLLLTACSHGEHNDAHFEKAPNVRISDKRALYCELSRGRPFYVDRCDSLLFDSLRSIACGETGIVEKHESDVEPGKWFRDADKNCFIPPAIDNGSDSTISKDMVLGLIAYSLVEKSEKNKNILGRTIEYGKSRDWIIGEAKDNVTLLSKCYVTPGLQGLLTEAFNYQGGSLTDVSSDDSLPGLSTGFRAHLDAISIVIRGKLKGKLSNLDMITIKEQVKRQPNNAVFQAIKAKYDDNDRSKTHELLLDTNHWPENHLPNNHENHCTEYLYQRDESPGDWAPCPTAVFKEYDATEWLFAAALVEDLL